MVLITKNLFNFFFLKLQNSNLKLICSGFLICVFIFCSLFKLYNYCILVYSTRLERELYEAKVSQLIELHRLLDVEFQKEAELTQLLMELNKIVQTQNSFFSSPTFWGIIGFCGLIGGVGLAVYFNYQSSHLIVSTTKAVCNDFIASNKALSELVALTETHLTHLDETTITSVMAQISYHQTEIAAIQLKIDAILATIGSG